MTTSTINSACIQRLLDYTSWLSGLGSVVEARDDVNMKLLPATILWRLKHQAINATAGLAKVAFPESPPERYG
jgi:hypothetical protein